MPSDLPGGPLGERMGSFLRHIREGGSDLADQELAVTWSETFPGLPHLRESLARWRDQTKGFAVTGFEPTRASGVVAILRGADAREWRTCLVIDPQPPHRILASAVFQSPPGVSAREAFGSDGPAMREIERCTPIVTGNTRVYYDRGEDYLAGERLMGRDVETFVMERRGRIVGFGSRAFPLVRIAGVIHRGLYSHRLRLLPEAQGEGVQGPMNALRMLSGAARGCLSYAFVAEGNEAAVRAMPGQSRASFWKVGASRIVLDVNGLAGRPLGRPATSSDVRRLVELFNSAHQHAELFVPYTEESLADRLQRDPNLYSWHDVALGKHAALGIWKASLGVRREADGATTNDVRALVLDYGCEPGADDELVALIESSCATLRDLGTTELSVFSSARAPLYASLASVAKRVEPYQVRCAAQPGADLDRRGVYVDQLYF